METFSGRRSHKIAPSTWQRPFSTLFHIPYSVVSSLKSDPMFNWSWNVPSTKTSTLPITVTHDEWIRIRGLNQTEVQWSQMGVKRIWDPVYAISRHWTTKDLTSFPSLQKADPLGWVFLNLKMPICMPVTSSLLLSFWGCIRESSIIIPLPKCAVSYALSPFSLPQLKTELCKVNHFKYNPVRLNLTFASCNIEVDGLIFRAMCLSSRVG